MLQNQNQDQDSIVRPCGTGHSIASNGIDERILASTSQDASANSDQETNNLAQAISLYLSQHRHRD